MDSVHGKQGWVDAYLHMLRTQRQLSGHTVDAYRRDLAELIALSGETDWAKLTHFDVRRYAAQLHSKQLEPRSIARKLSGWRGFFDWLSTQTTLAANPATGVRAPKRGKPLPKALSVDDAVHLVSTKARTAAAGEEPAELCDSAMFELLYSSGLRVSELTGLDVRHQKAGPHGKASPGWLEGDEVIVTGKGDKQRRVPIGKAALAALAAWLAVRPPPVDGSDALFVTTRGTRMSPRVVQLRLKAHGLKAGTPASVHPHMLRHSFASHMLQSSEDLRAVQDMLGHSSISSTQVYTALDFQHLSKVYDKAHPRAKLK